MDESEILCTKCGRSWPSSGFYWYADGKVRRPCKECYRDWHRARYAPKDGADDTPRNCAWCGVSYRPKQRRFSLYCSRDCLSKAREASPQRRDQILRSKYGISAAEYDQRLEAQHGGCAICGNGATQTRFGKYLNVDHDHQTARVRGLLCDQCNHAIGLLRDDPALLRAAADYLERHR
jgi:hypothetical protein